MLKALGTPAQDELPYRTLPNNIDMEQALLGALLQNPAVLDKIDGIITADDFNEPVHREIYAIAKQRIEDGKPANAVALRTFFENHERVNDEMTMPQYIARLVVNAALNLSVEHYAQDLRSLAMRRQIINLAAEMAEVAYDSPPDADAMTQVETAERELLAIAERDGASGGAAPFAVAMREAVSRIEKAYQGKTGMTGMSTGLIDLDTALGGLGDGLLYVPAGRPGAGKTALVVGIGWHAATSGLPVLMFSLEMPKDQIAERVISAEADIEAERLRLGKLKDEEANDDEPRRMVEVEQKFRGAPFWIDDRGSLSIEQLCARARRHKRQHDTRLIIVDYIQLLNSANRRRSDSRVNELTEITGKLKALAKELRVPVIALSQLSRAVETRENKRPMLSDLRESGSIEQDADVVMTVYRAEYYVERERPEVCIDPKTKEKSEEYKLWEAKLAAVAGLAEIGIPKNRFGRTGVVNVAWDGQNTRFVNLAKDSAKGDANDR